MESAKLRKRRAKEEKFKVCTEAAKPICCSSLPRQTVAARRMRPCLRLSFSGWPAKQQSGASPPNSSLRVVTQRPLSDQVSERAA